MKSYRKVIKRIEKEKRKISKLKHISEEIKFNLYNHLENKRRAIERKLHSDEN